MSSHLNYTVLKQSICEQVTLCIIYDNGGHEVTYPDVNNCSIPAELQIYVIEGQFNKKSSYQISFRVNENGYPGSNTWIGNFASEAEALSKYMAC